MAVKPVPIIKGSTVVIQSTTRSDSRRYTSQMYIGQPDVNKFPLVVMYLICSIILILRDLDPETGVVGIKKENRTTETNQ